MQGSAQPGRLRGKKLTMSQMDRALEKRRGPSTRSVVLAGFVVLTFALGYLMLTRSGESRLRVDPTRMTTAEVRMGEFREYYPFDGRVEPLTTVYLDIEEGGRVEEIFVDGGQFVEKGDLILRFSNATLQRSSIDTETRLVENLNSLRNTQFNLAQSSLMLREQLLDLEYRILDLEKTYARYEALKNDDAVTREAYERARDELDYLSGKRNLLIERIEREDQLSELQLEQAESSIERLNLSLDLLTQIVESLEVRAPISGFLSSIDAQLGQNINRGQRIGQIDLLDDYKISVSIDQYYISRVELGTRGRFELDGHSYDVVVDKIFPEIVNDAFRVDVAFAGEVPANLRRGQRLTVEMSFGEPAESLMVARGGFHQQTSGRWVYLISEDRESARRTPIRLGRQNPRFVEVLEGLRPGDWIVTSSYDAFNQADELSFTQPIEFID
jgi:HlyD family secretion protein